MSKLGRYVLHSKNSVDENSVVYILLDRNTLTLEAQRFKEYEPNDSYAKSRGAIRDALPIQRIIRTFNYIACHSWLGVEQSAGDEKTNFYVNNERATRPRVDFMVDPIRTADGVCRAFRYIFTAQDPDFSFNRALDKLFARKSSSSASKKKGPSKRKDEEEEEKEEETDVNAAKLVPYTDKGEWIREGLSSYTDERFFETEESYKSYALPFCDAENPGDAYKIFDFDWSNTLLRRIEANTGVTIPELYYKSYFAQPTTVVSVPLALPALPAVSPVASTTTTTTTTTTQLPEQEEDQLDQDDQPDQDDQLEDEDMDPNPMSEEERLQEKLNAEQQQQQQQTTPPQQPLQQNGNSLAEQYGNKRMVFPYGAFDISHERREPNMVGNALCMEFPDLQTIAAWKLAGSIPELTLEEKREERKLIGNNVSKITSIEMAQAYAKRHRESCLLEEKKCAILEAEERVRKEREKNTAELLKELEENGGRTELTEEELKACAIQDEEKVDRIVREKGPEIARRAAKRYLDKLSDVESTQMFLSVLCRDDECPATKIVSDFLLDKLKRDPKWSAIRPVEHMVDSSLSTFGNFMARESLNYEFLMGVFAVHEEILLTQIACLSSFEIMNASLRIHLLYGGPAASGKSFIQEIHQALSIPEMIRTVASQTEKALTTDINTNGTRMMMDELNENWTSKKDGTGDPLLKSIMTNGYGTNEQCVYDKEKKKRVMIKTVSKCRSMILANTNNSFFSIVEAMRSRWMTRSVIGRKREDKDVMSEKSKMESDVNSSEKTKKMDFMEEWYIRQIVSCFLHVWMRIDPSTFRIDMTIPESYAPKVWTFLEKKGFHITGRDKERFMLYCRAVCIYDAISRVFFTETHYKKGTPFDYKQVLTCFQYMTVSMEHLWFAISHTFPSYVNPNMDVVLKAINDIVASIDTLEDKVKCTGYGEAKKFDYNIYSIGADSGGSVANKQDGAIYAMAETIANRVSMSGHVDLSVENIVDVLYPLSKGSIESSHYRKDGVVDTSKKNTIKVLEFRSGLFPKLYISRDYLEQRINEPYHKLMELSLKQTMNKDYYELDPREPQPTYNLSTEKEKAEIEKLITTSKQHYPILKRVLLGYSLRNPDYDHYKDPTTGLDIWTALNSKVQPQLFKVMEMTKCDLPEDTRVANRDHMPYGCSFLVHDKSEDTMLDISEWIEAKDMDTTLRVKWLATQGVSLEEIQKKQELWPEKVNVDYLYANRKVYYPAGFDKDSYLKERRMDGVVSKDAPNEGVKKQKMMVTSDDDDDALQQQPLQGEDEHNKMLHPMYHMVMQNRESHPLLQQEQQQQQQEEEEVLQPSKKKRKIVEEDVTI
jgi:hypothetical protein